MRKLVSIIILSLLILSGLLFLPEFGPGSMSVSGAVITVNDDGGADYQTIQEAIDNATAGDTIHIWEGRYYEQLTISKTLTLIGNGTTNTTINGTGTGHVVHINTDWVNITGFNITGSGLNWGDAGIYLYYSDHCNITWNNFSNNYACIRAYHSNNLLIENNNCSNNQIGIWLDNYCDFNIIRQNICENNNNYGIYLYYYCDDNIIENNSCDGNNYGMYIYQYIYRNVVKNNTFDKNNNRGIYFYRGFECLFENNSFNFNPSYGIYIRYSNSNTFKNNNLTTNGNGIYNYRSDSNIYKNNWFNTSWDWSYEFRLYSSRSCTLINNTFVQQGIYLYGSSLSYWNTHSIDTTNTVNGKPIYYIKDKINGSLTPDAGQLILVNCYNVTVENMTMNGVYVSIQLGFSNKCIVRNNTLINNYYCIYVSRYISNNIFLNNNCSNSYYGIYFDYSVSNNIMKNNVFYSNWNYGIYLYYGDTNIIENNTLVQCYMGIYLNWHSNYNNVRNNTCLRNYFGMYFYYCTENVVENNTCNLNNNYGIYSYQSWNNRYLNNTCNDNSFGISLDYLSRKNFVKNNTCYSNNNYGIYLYYSDNNTLENNNCSSNRYGIALNYLCSWNILKNNTCNDNSNYGIYAYYSNTTVYENNSCTNSNQGIFLSDYCFNSVIKNNYCHSNSNNGIYVYLSRNLTIENNNLSTNNRGLYLDTGCYESVIRDNTFASNTNYGIYISQTDNLTVNNNNCSYNQREGIHLYLADNITLTKNWCMLNSENGIGLDNANRNVIDNNFCNNNSQYGLYLYDSDYNQINNTQGNTNLDHGLNLYYSDHNIITNNTFRYNTNCGSWLRQSPINTFFRNILSNNKYGLNIGQDSDNITIEQNTIEWSAFNAVYTDQTENITIFDNDFSSSKSPLIYLDESKFHKVIQNRLDNDNSAGIWIENGFGHVISDNTITTIGASDHGIVLELSANNCTISKNSIVTNDDNSDGIRLDIIRDCDLIDNNIQTLGNKSHGIWGLKCERITYKKNTINVYGRETAGMKLDDSVNDLEFGSKIKSWGPLSPGATLINSIITFKDSSLHSTSNVSFNLTGGADVVAINVKYNSGNVLHNSVSKLTIKNYLTISVNYSDGEPVNDVDVNVTTDGNPVYRSSGYNGMKPKTGGNGRTPKIIITSHDYVNTIVPNYYTTNIYLKKSIQGRDWSDNRNSIDMTRSHTEYFEPGIDIMEPFAVIDFVGSLPDGLGVHIKARWVKDAARYQLFMNGSGDPKGSYFMVKELMGKNNNETIITGLVDGVEYTFKLKIEDESGLWSEFSDEVSSIPMDIQAPATPTGLKLDDVTAENVNLSWSQNSEDDLMGYNVYRKGTDGLKSLGITQQNQFMDTDVEEGQNYTYAITAFDEVPNHSSKTAWVGPAEIPIIPPRIIYKAPGQNALGVLVGSKIKITFSKTMVRNSVISAFEISPFVEGKFTFSSEDQNFSFTPIQPLEYSTKYTITINTTATDLKFKNQMVSDIIWSFTTEPDIYPPEIIGHSPKGKKVHVNSEITVTFSEFMNKDSLQGAFSINPKVNGTISWEGNIFIFTPDSLLEYNTTYVIEITSDAKDEVGNPLKAGGHTWNFKTLTLEDSAPFIIDHSPMGTNVPVDQEIYIVFSKPMIANSAQKAIKVLPPVVGGKFKWEGDDNNFKLILSHSANLKLNTTYEVTVTDDAKDVHGKNLMESYTWNFTTGFDLGYGPAKIISIFPELNSNAEINTKVKVGFDRDIISQNAKLVVKSSNGTPLVGAVKYSNIKHVLTFTRQDSKYFEYNTIYFVEMSGITVNIGEFSIESNNNTYTWSFSTKDITEADSDKDGINDEWELENDLNQFDEMDAHDDFDNDGLVNLAEFLNQTNPNNKDTDGDNLTDFDELKTYLTDPNDDDSDDDSANDGSEIEMGTDPLDDEDYPGKKAKAEPDDDEDEPVITEPAMMAIAIIIIIIVVLLILLLVMRGRKSSVKGNGKVNGRPNEKEISNTKLDRRRESKGTKVNDEIKKSIKGKK